MRVFFVFTWIALTMTVTVLSGERSKRDLLFIKKIVDTLFGTQRSLRSEEDSKFYKISGRDNVLLKNTPKHYNIKETEVIIPKKIILEPVDLTMPYIKSYLGTKTSNETVGAINQVKNLLNLGILSEKENEEIQEFIVPLMPTNIKYAMKEENEIYTIKSPISTTIKKPEYATSSKIINYGPIIGRESVTIEVPPMPVKPTHLKVSEIFKPKYSYKQTEQDGSITTFKSEGDHNIIVTETEIKPPLPSYIKLRLEEVAAKCITRIHCSQPILDNQSFYFPSYETLGVAIPGLITPTYTVTNPISTPPPTPLIVERLQNFNLLPDSVKDLTYSPAFGVFEKSDYLVGRDIGEPIIVKGNPTLKKTTVTVLRKGGSKGVSVNFTRRNDKINGTKSSHENNQTKTNLSHNRHRNTDNEDVNSDLNSNYEAINEKTVPEREEIKTKLVDLKNDNFKLLEDADIIRSNYLYIPPLIDNVLLGKLNKRIKDDQEFTNMHNLSNNSQLNNLEKTMTKKPKVEYSLIKHPIIVADNTPYSYKQIKQVDSSITTKGKLQNVSNEININEENENISNVIF